MDAAYLGGGLVLDGLTAVRAEELAARLASLRAAYYAGTPSISDDAYDALEDELRTIAPAHPLLARVGSPPMTGTWEKARHEIPMGSLNKVSSEAEFDEWLARSAEVLGRASEDALLGELFVSEKLDGLSVELIYRDGRLAAAITRGDGETGELITANVGRMRGVPSKIPYSASLSVRGEIIMRIRDRQLHFSDYASTRNAAAGTSRRLDGAGSEHLTVMCYDVADEVEFADEGDKIALLRRLGFATPNCFRGDPKSVLALYERYGAEARDALDYEIDGLVVRVASVQAQALLGELNRRPRGAVAFKFASPKKLTHVIAISWETGPSGRVTPIALVEPVELVGAQIRRASLHNLATVRRLGIGVGDEVLVSRRNDVIPYVEEVVHSAGHAASEPEACAACGSPLAHDGEYLVCRNDQCRARVTGRIHIWIAAVGALEWGDKLIEALVDKGLVREPSDLYRLGVGDIAALDRHGEKSAENALRELTSRLPLRLPTFLAGLGIEGFSLQTARLVASAGYDLDRLLVVSPTELATLAGLGPVKASIIVEGLAARRAEIDRLRDAGLGPVASEHAGRLEGKTLCITGTHRRGRKELVRFIEEQGGRVVPGVVKDLDFLLIADIESETSKAVKARRYGTRLVSEADLDRIVGESKDRA
ncbi:MAG: NAD-dependent DNA ligase LigA [Myxococcales bacterium]|nr:NAD-dependent DNA ligase LigA [Myxococcales bacterium]